MTIIFQGNDHHFPGRRPSFSMHKNRIFQGKCWDVLTVFSRWRRLGWSRQLPMTSTTSGRGSRPHGTAGSLRNREVIFGFKGACALGRVPICDDEAGSCIVSRRAAGAEGLLADREASLWFGVRRCRWELRGPLLACRAQSSVPASLSQGPTIPLCLTGLPSEPPSADWRSERPQ